MGKKSKKSKKMKGAHSSKGKGVNGKVKTGKASPPIQKKNTKVVKKAKQSQLSLGEVAQSMKVMGRAAQKQLELQGIEENDIKKLESDAALKQVAQKDLKVHKVDSSLASSVVKIVGAEKKVLDGWAKIAGKSGPKPKETELGETQSSPGSELEKAQHAMELEMSQIEKAENTIRASQKKAKNTKVVSTKHTAKNLKTAKPTKNKVEIFMKTTKVKKGDEKSIPAQ